jgi:hypothetical protein
MASFNKFNAFAANMPNGGVNLASDTLKVMLTNTAPVATNSVYTDISGGEVANGNGYTTGGTAATLTSSSQTSGLYKLILQAVTFTASGGSIGPLRYAVLYDTAGAKDLIGWWDYGTSITLNSGDTFTVTFDAVNGVFQLQ